MKCHTDSMKRRDGNVLVLSLLVVSLLVAFTLALFTSVEKNVASARYFNTRSDLRRYAESGVFVAIHDLRYNMTGSSGNIGTDAWSDVNDVGADGIAGTSDEGEDDGLPTIGEPNVVPQSTGPAALGAELVTHIFDGAGGSKRIVATVRNQDTSATVERVYRARPVTIPMVLAVVVDPSADLDLRGNSFLIDGRYHDSNGVVVTGNDRYGLATLAGDIPGENLLSLLTQIPSRAYDQIIGSGSDPSIGEVSTDTVQPRELLEQIRAAHSATVSPGTYSGFDLEAESGETFPVTWVDGDLHLSGRGRGNGVLVVDGSLTVSGQFEFKGLILVGGDLRMTGGGTSMHLIGSVVVCESISAVEESPEVSVSGHADLLFSSVLLQDVQDRVARQPEWDPVHYRD